MMAKENKSPPRRKNGRINWKAEATKRQVHAQLAQGRTHAEIGALFGVCTQSVRQAMDRYGYGKPPKGYVLLADLARALDGSSALAMYYAGKLGGLERWGRQWIIPTAHFEAIVSKYAEELDAPPEGYLCVADLAERWELSNSVVHQRIRKHKLKGIRVKGRKRSVMYYAPRDVLPLKPMRITKRPAHLLSRGKLADICGVSKSTITRWRHRDGLPAYPWKAHDNCSLLYDPEQVHAWLLTRPRLAHYVPRLEAALKAGV